MRPPLCSLTWDLHLSDIHGISIGDAETPLRPITLQPFKETREQLNVQIGRGLSRNELLA